MTGTGNGITKTGGSPEKGTTDCIERDSFIERDETFMGSTSKGG